MTDLYQQGPVSSLRDSDLIVIRQSNGRDMYLPVSVLVAHVADTISKASIHVGQVNGLALVATTGKYSDLHGKPGDPPGPPEPPPGPP